MASKTKMIACDMIEATTATQIRKQLDAGVIDDYCDALKGGAKFPAIDVFKEKGSSRYILADGFHRLIAYIHADREEIECNVHVGGMREALEFAFGANSMHGLRRTNADKRHAVEMALKDPYFGQLSRQDIADLCRVTKRTVQKIANKAVVDDPDADMNGEPGESQEPSADDHRPTKPEPTQVEIERDELRAALGMVKAFPYGGEDVGKLELTAADVGDLEYVSTWCASAVIALRTEK